MQIFAYIFIKGSQTFYFKEQKRNEHEASYFKKKKQALI